MRKKIKILPGKQKYKMEKNKIMRCLKLAIRIKEKKFNQNLLLIKKFRR